MAAPATSLRTPPENFGIFPAIRQRPVPFASRPGSGFRITGMRRRSSVSAALDILHGGAFIPHSAIPNIQRDARGMRFSRADLLCLPWCSLRKP